MAMVAACVCGGSWGKKVASRRCVAQMVRALGPPLGGDICVGSIPTRAATPLPHEICGRLGNTLMFWNVLADTPEAVHELVPGVHAAALGAVRTIV